MGSAVLRLSAVDFLLGACVRIEYRPGYFVQTRALTPEAPAVWLTRLEVWKTSSVLHKNWHYKSDHILVQYYINWTTYK